MSQINSDDYISKYLANKKVEWLIEHGKTHETMYFRGAIGDRWTIYVATKRNKNVVDFHTVHNSYNYGTTKGSYIASIKDYVLIMHNTSQHWNNSVGYLVKQLMRQGVEPKAMNKQWRIRFCRSTFFMKLWNQTEFTPWVGMKINLKNGTLINKPNRQAVKDYKYAKDTDRKLRKSNRIANKNNADANARFVKADGNYALLPMDDIFKLRNTDRRNDIMNFYGLEKIIATLETKVEDEDTIDGRFYRLINVNIPDLASGQDRNDWGLYLEMLNPSTGESHFEGIANVSMNSRGWGNEQIEEATVKAALSWRDGDGMMSTGSSSTWQTKSTSNNYVIPIKLT